MDSSHRTDSYRGRVSLDADLTLPRTLVEKSLNNSLRAKGCAFRIWHPPAREAYACKWNGQVKQNKEIENMNKMESDSKRVPPTWARRRWLIISLVSLIMGILFLFFVGDMKNVDIVGMFVGVFFVTAGIVGTVMWIYEKFQRPKNPLSGSTSTRLLTGLLVWIVVTARQSPCLAAEMQTAGSTMVTTSLTTIVGDKLEELVDQTVDKLLDNLPVIVKAVKAMPRIAWLFLIFVLLVIAGLIYLGYKFYLWMQEHFPHTPPQPPPPPDPVNPAIAERGAQAIGTNYAFPEIVQPKAFPQNVSEVDTNIYRAFLLFGPDTLTPTGYVSKGYATILAGVNQNIGFNQPWIQMPAYTTNNPTNMLDRSGMLAELASVGLYPIGPYGPRDCFSINSKAVEDIPWIRCTNQMVCITNGNRPLQVLVFQKGIQPTRGVNPSDTNVVPIEMSSFMTNIIPVGVTNVLYDTLADPVIGTYRTMIPATITPQVK